MIEIIKKVIASVLTALYQPFGFSVIMAIMFMFLYMFAQKYGWKRLAQYWWQEFKNNQKFRWIFFLFFYTALILFRTLLNRTMWANPVSNIIGVWGLYNENGEFTTEAIENLLLFIPFTVLLLWNFRERILGQSLRLFLTVGKSIVIVFLFSLTIEFLQLFLRLGTFQLSDLFYNTLGGLIGGLIYWCGYKLTHRNKKEK